MPESLLMMASIEEGISILPDSCTEKLSGSDNLVFIPLEGAEEKEDIPAVWRK